MAIYRCDVCKKQFQKRGAEKYKHHFCSMACRRQYEGREQVNCQTCGASFFKKRAERLNKPMHFCSIACYRVYQRQTMVVSKICPVCENEFTPSGFGQMRQRQVYCSHECKGVAHRGENNHAWLGGHPMYRGPNWPALKQQVVQLDNGQCVLCGASNGLNVHHIEPYRIAQNNDYSNLATLCDTCHGNADRDYNRGVTATERLIRAAIQWRC